MKKELFKYMIFFIIIALVYFPCFLNSEYAKMMNNTLLNFIIGILAMIIANLITYKFKE